MQHYVMIGMGMGVLIEALAYALCLWLYHRAWARLINVVLVFGLVYGGLSGLLAGHGFFLQFGAGAAVGLALEIANDRLFRIWYFPGDPWPLRGQAAVVTVGLSWGLVPVIISLLARDVFI